MVSLFNGLAFTRWLLSFIGSSLCLITCIHSASPNYAQDRKSPQQRPAYSELSVIRHEVNNHESEIRMMEAKLNNYEETIETFRQNLADNGELYKDLIRDNTTNVNYKIDTLETKAKGFAADMGVLKTHANESSIVLGQYKQKISDLEKIIEAQQNQLSHLEMAIKSLMDLMQVKDETFANADKSDSAKTYRVQAGDTLEKIAKNHKTTIRALREKNNLLHDKIVVGQKLIIPS